MAKQKRHFIVIQENDGKSVLFRMKEWLRQNPSFMPQGLTSKNTSHELRSGLKKEGWRMEEQADKVLLYKPEKFNGKKTASQPEQDKNGQTYWFVGADFGKGGNQTQRFYSEGIWECGYKDKKHSAIVKSMKQGDRIAIKSSYTRKHGLPFDNKGKSVSVMGIKFIGTITKNLGDGVKLEVKWTEVNPKREWYFNTQRTTIWCVKPEEWMAIGLIDFTFNGKEQDVNRFLSEPYWSKKYGIPKKLIATPSISDTTVITPSAKGTPLVTTYSLENIISDGCFIELAQLKSMTTRLSIKKNIILQGPPGTGKTWLAERLAYAFVGSQDNKKVRSIQFHPNLSYEDFVRGWRPAGKGELSLVDGPFMEMVRIAQNDQSSKYVVVIEEINRGNTAQIFGEMLTLLEPDRRNSNCALELCYKRTDEARTYIPDNLYVIGTMNIADRSLALVDFALRRRFAFVELEPNFGAIWRDWLTSKCGINLELVRSIEKKMLELNKVISEDASLGKQFCIGHSYVTPTKPDYITDPREWFLSVVQTEIGPLLDEYWFDSREKALKAKQQLIENF